MKRTTLLCLLSFLTAAGAQVAPIPPGAHAPDSARPRRLKWEWRREEELSPSQSMAGMVNLSASERDHLLSAIAGELSDEEFESDEARKKAAAEARAKYVVLGADGRFEVIVQAVDVISCSGTGNCAFWIMRPRGDSYSPLLKAEAQTFTIQPTRTHGFYDIVLTRHDSAFESEVKVYRFDGEHYQEGECYTAEWSQSGSDGKSHRLQDPRLTPCGAR